MIRGPEESRFVVDLIADLGRDGYSISAWERFIISAGARARAGIAEFPSRLATFSLWIAAGVACLAVVIITNPAILEDAVAIGGAVVGFLAGTLWTLTHLSMARSSDGEVTSAITSAVLAGAAVATLLAPPWMADEWVQWAVIFLHAPILLNLYLLWRASKIARGR